MSYVIRNCPNCNAPMHIEHYAGVTLSDLDRPRDKVWVLRCSECALCGPKGTVYDAESLFDVFLESIRSKSNV